MGGAGATPPAHKHVKKIAARTLAASVMTSPFVATALPPARRPKIIVAAAYYWALQCKQPDPPCRRQ